MCCHSRMAGNELSRTGAGYVLCMLELTAKVAMELQSCVDHSPASVAAVAVKGRLTRPPQPAKPRSRLLGSPHSSIC
jgi:hypothetical protein